MRTVQLRSSQAGGNRRGWYTPNGLPGSQVRLSDSPRLLRVNHYLERKAQLFQRLNVGFE